MGQSLSPPASCLGLVVSVTELPWQQNGDHMVPDPLLLPCVGDGRGDRKNSRVPKGDGVVIYLL